MKNIQFYNLQTINDDFIISFLDLKNLWTIEKYD